MTEENGTATAVLDAPPETATADLWDEKLEAVLERAGVSEAITAKFRAARLLTVGDLAKWLQKARNDGPGEVARFNRITDLVDGDAAGRVDEVLAPILAQVLPASDQNSAEPATPEPVKTSKPEPEDDPALTLRQIEKLERKCAKLEADWEEAKEEASSAKKAFDVAVEDLRKKIRARNTPVPLFDKKPTADETKADSGETIVAETKPAPVEDESWKKVPLAEVLADLPPKKLEILTNAELTTLGEFTAFQTAKGTFDWGLKGIGLEWRTKIEDATVNWLTKWRAERPAEEEAARH